MMFKKVLFNDLSQCYYLVSVKPIPGIGTSPKLDYFGCHLNDCAKWKGIHSRWNKIQFEPIVRVIFTFISSFIGFMSFLDGGTRQTFFPNNLSYWFWDIGFFQLFIVVAIFSMNVFDSFLMWAVFLYIKSKSGNF